MIPNKTSAARDRKSESRQSIHPGGESVPGARIGEILSRVSFSFSSHYVFSYYRRQREVELKFSGSAIKLRWIILFLRGPPPPPPPPPRSQLRRAIRLVYGRSNRKGKLTKNYHPAPTNYSGVTGVPAISHQREWTNVSRNEPIKKARCQH